MKDPEFKFALTNELIGACEGTNFKPEDFLPQQSEFAATGFDVRCAELKGVELVPQRFYKISLGFRAFLPTGWWAELKPRSSSFIKKNLHSLYGTIDENFEHTWMYCFQYIPDEQDCINRRNLKKIEFGERVAQIIPVKREVMKVSSISNEEIENLFSNRVSTRTGGFGSSGNF